MGQYKTLLATQITQLQKNKKKGDKSIEKAIGTDMHTL